MCLTASAGARRANGQWSYFHFDGQAFVAGPSADGTSLALRPGVRPVLVKPGEKPAAVKLTWGAGALAGICYIQRSGGKLKPGAAFLPAAGKPVQLFSGGRVVATTQTDEEGYFLVTVGAGKYQVKAKEMIEVAVENGATTLIPLRVGKRMAD